MTQRYTFNPTDYSEFRKKVSQNQNIFKKTAFGSKKQSNEGSFISAIIRDKDTSSVVYLNNPNISI